LASAAASVSASNDDPPRSSRGSVRWSFSQPASNTSSSPAAAQVSSSVVQLTAWGDVLNPTLPAAFT
jgi:hypothetical protein